jgi:hypothetical protein
LGKVTKITKKFVKIFVNFLRKAKKIGYLNYQDPTHNLRSLEKVLILSFIINTSNVDQSCKHSLGQLGNESRQDNHIGRLGKAMPDWPCPN